MALVIPFREFEVAKNLLAECEYPETLFLVRERIRDKFMCQRISETEQWAVTAHESESAVLEYVSRTRSNGVRDGVSGQVFAEVNLEILQLSFDEAREVALGRPLPVVALAIQRDAGEQLLHFVR